MSPGLVLASFHCRWWIVVKWRSFFRLFYVADSLFFSNTITLLGFISSDLIEVYLGFLRVFEYLDVYLRVMHVCIMSQAIISSAAIRRMSRLRHLRGLSFGVFWHFWWLSSSQCFLVSFSSFCRHGDNQCFSWTCYRFKFSVFNLQQSFIPCKWMDRFTNFTWP